MQKISRKEYGRLKTMCQSKNIADVNLAGILVSELRRNKKLPLRLVNNLFSCLCDGSITISHWRISAKRSFSHVQYGEIEYGSKFQLKQSWLNGALK